MVDDLTCERGCKPVRFSLWTELACSVRWTSTDQDMQHIMADTDKRKLANCT